jgi:hypothetical protein
MNVDRMLEPIMDPIEKLESFYINPIVNTLKDVVVDEANIGFQRSRASLLCPSGMSKRNGPSSIIQGLWQKRRALLP